MTREIPQDLYDEVCMLATAIAQPLAPAEERVDKAMAFEALAKLQALFDEHERAGTSHPFLTETLADFTVDDTTRAIALYKLALDQCVNFPHEPCCTKRIALARRLHWVGRVSEAREQLALARRDAFAERDSSVMAEMDELAELLRPQDGA